MGLSSSVREEEEGRDYDDYKHDNDDADDDDWYDLRITFPGRVIVGPDTGHWIKGGNGSHSNDHVNINERQQWLHRSDQ